MKTLLFFWSNFTLCSQNNSLKSCKRDSLWALGLRAALRPPDSVPQHRGSQGPGTCPFATGRTSSKASLPGGWQRRRSHSKGWGWPEGASAGAQMEERCSRGRRKVVLGGGWSGDEGCSAIKGGQLSLLCHLVMSGWRSPRIRGSLRHIC